VADIKRLPALPAERALKVLSGRWKSIILYHLFNGPLRLSELMRQVEGVSQKVLVQQLRELEEHGLVHREVFLAVPARVEYSTTPLGLSLEPILRALCAWGQRHAQERDELDRIAACKLDTIRVPASVARMGARALARAGSVST
jgi:DNA-binding HxlR family transcriptional regulator